MFELIHTDKNTGARAGKLRTNHGIIDTPAFMPVATKAAVKLLTEGIYAELSTTNVHVTAIFPGAIATNISENSGVQGPTGPAAEEAAKKFKALPAPKAAKIILDAIEKNKVLVYVGSDAKMMNRLYRLAPQFATNFIAKKMRSLLP